MINGFIKKYHHGLYLREHLDKSMLLDTLKFSIIIEKNNTASIQMIQ